PLDTGPVTAEVTLVADPVPDGRGGVTADVRLDGRRLRAHARRAAASSLDDRLTGERVLVIGDLQPPGETEWRLRYRHLAGRLEIDTVVGWRTGDPVTRLANGLRRTLAQGAEVLSDRHASLLAGLTLGDVRAQPADMSDAFRAAGMTHLLAVSGQNVAFVLVLAAPVLSRLRFGPRLVVTLSVLAGFALVWRFEPSVLRATAMAAVAATGAALGRPASTLRTLGLGVTGVLLVDPLLATSLAFRLSVVAAAGIVVGAAPLERALPGPRWLTVPLAVTVAAQLAVAPLLVASFGSVPVASLPANLLAVPAAGPVMIWGLTGGLAAGLSPGTAAAALHVPTLALLAWIDGVAAAAARWPLGQLGASHVIWLAAILVVGLGIRAWSPRGGRWLPALAAVAVLGHAGVASGGPAVIDGEPLGAGATLWKGGGAAVLVVDGRARGETVLAGLRERGVVRVDLVVLRTPAKAAAEVAGTVRRRWPGTAILAPEGTSRLPDRASIPPPGSVFDVGGLRLTVVTSSPERLDVDVGVRGERARR
ncbi:MAG TPA: ComEC/Rec2 family competence protein, partial [Acidimicrobiales bacterium]|nr:ComEC/Rec2 family competence protein [Acidimicrobiales bacterium]